MDSRALNEPLMCDEQLVRRLAEKITVYGYSMKVEFKLGFEIDAEGLKLGSDSMLCSSTMDRKVLSCC